MLSFIVEGLEAVDVDGTTASTEAVL